MASNMQKKPSRMSKVFVLENHPVFCEAQAHIINNEGDLKVCGAAESAEAAMRVVPKLKPYLILVHMGLAGKNGLEFIKEMRGVDRRVKLSVVSMRALVSRMKAVNFGGPSLSMRVIRNSIGKLVPSARREMTSPQ